MTEQQIEALLNKLSNAAAFFTMEYNKAKAEGVNIPYGLDSKLRPILREALLASPAEQPRDINESPTEWGRVLDPPIDCANEQEAQALVHDLARATAKSEGDTLGNGVAFNPPLAKTAEQPPAVSLGFFHPGAPGYVAPAEQPGAPEPLPEFRMTHSMFNHKDFPQSAPAGEEPSEALRLVDIDWVNKALEYAGENRRHGVKPDLLANSINKFLTAAVQQARLEAMKAVCDGCEKGYKYRAGSHMHPLLEHWFPCAAEMIRALKRPAEKQRKE